MKIPKNEHVLPNLGIFDMSNRVNQIRVWSKFFGQFGVYQRHGVQVFTTPIGAAAHIKDLGITPKGAQVLSTGQHFERAEVGNEHGWVTYEINPEGNIPEISESLDAAMQMHLGFYDEGESCTPYRTEDEVA